MKVNKDLMAVRRLPIDAKKFIDSKRKNDEAAEFFLSSIIPAAAILFVFLFIHILTKGVS